LQSICHGVVRLERLTAEYGGARRRLIVDKMRGLQFREGHHDFSIQPGGIAVYPRMVAGFEELPKDEVWERGVAGSGITELDSLLGGGIHYGTSTLVMGPAGTGKSTFLTQYALSLAREGKHVACYVFEETRGNFLERARGLGMDLRAELASGNMTVEQIDPAEMSPGEFADHVKNAVQHRGVGVVMVDSLNGYLNAMPTGNFLLIQMHELLTYLNCHGVLTMMTLAQHGLLGSAMSSPVDITYLADTVVVLRYFEAFGSVMQALAVIKKRTGGHERSIRQFYLTSKGIQIGEPLKDFDGVLTGVPTFRGDRDALISGSSS
jgi:circadian clock protein KaiC